MTSPAGAVRNHPPGRRSRLALPLIGAGVIVVAALWAFIAFLRPLPPRTVTIATGPEGGAYHEVGKRYRELLAHQGITVELLSTAGARENLARLRDAGSRVDVAFLQGGLTSEKESPDLQSLGTVFYEPLWFFHRGVLESGSLEALRGRKISVGPEGSGTQALARELLARNGIDQQFAELLLLSPQEAAEKLVRGEIDAAIMLAAWNSSVVRRLLTEETIGLASFPRADAYVALYPFLNKLTVPAGVGDLAKNRPPRDVTLLAPKASLVVRRNLHPAIQSLLLDAAEQIHSGPTIFQQSKQFPAPEAIDLPLSSEARQFYRSGRSFLERHLPFWLAVAIGRLLVLLIPLIGLIYPLFRLMPALYAWEVRWRIFRMYRELRLLEKDAESPGSGRPVDELTQGLDRLEAKASRLQVPLFYTNLLYTLRAHIALVRGRLTKAERTPIAE
jgi:TRAP transporter TAXI family solute receptor